MNNLIKNFSLQIFSDEEIELETIGKIMDALENSEEFCRMLIDFILSEKSISDKNQITSFNIHSKQEEQLSAFLPEKEKIRIILTSGASCPDAVVDAVIVRILELMEINPDFENLILV